MKPSGLPKLFVAAGCLLVTTPSYAQHTTVYAYDSLGRLTNAGVNSIDTAYYVLDAASNRRVVRCCKAIGGWQVKEDGFDPYFYLQTYPDILAAGVDPYEHWLQWGASENRWPNQYFNTAWYRSTYGIPAGVNPLTDYHTSGWRLGRNPSLGFSTTLYNSAHTDVFQAGADPLHHYLRWGYGEGRAMYAVP
jgi:hypothetical protein